MNKYKIGYNNSSMVFDITFIIDPEFFTFFCIAYYIHFAGHKINMQRVLQTKNGIAPFNLKDEAG